GGGLRGDLAVPDAGRGLVPRACRVSDPSPSRHADRDLRARRRARAPRPYRRPRRVAPGRRAVDDGRPRRHAQRAAARARDRAHLAALAQFAVAAENDPGALRQSARRRSTGCQITGRRDTALCRQARRRRGDARSDWPMTLLDIRAEGGASVALEVPAADRGFIHLLEGEADIGAGQAHVRAGDVAWFEPTEGGNGYDTLRLEARVKLRALLYSSPPIDEPVVAYGPFVMNSEAEIHADFDDYRAGRFVA